jgi:chitinase
VTEVGRQNFANSSVELLKNLGFDGIDIDFEVSLLPFSTVFDADIRQYPANNKEAGQFVDTLRRLREVCIFMLTFC